jgi:hypothetical protein
MNITQLREKIMLRWHAAHLVDTKPDPKHSVMLTIAIDEMLRMEGAYRTVPKECHVTGNIPYCPFNCRKDYVTNSCSLPQEVVCPAKG